MRFWTFKLVVLSFVFGIVFGVLTWLVGMQGYWFADAPSYGLVNLVNSGWFSVLCVVVGVCAGVGLFGNLYVVGDRV